MTGLEIGALISGILAAAGIGTQAGMSEDTRVREKRRRQRALASQRDMTAMEQVAQSRIDRRNRLASGSPLASSFVGTAPRMPQAKDS
jgi:hypothetical protein